MSDFSIQLDVRWGDVDSFGHVNNAVFLAYLEECRSRWMDSVPSHWQDGETGPVVANININYRRPVHWPQRIVVTLRPESPGRSSIKLHSEIRAAESSGNGKPSPAPYADAVVTLVWIDRQSGESVPLPTALRDLAR
jgi:acyl-CoA thioester hydrolase